MFVHNVSLKYILTKTLKWEGDLNDHKVQSFCFTDGFREKVWLVEGINKYVICLSLGKVVWKLSDSLNLTGISLRCKWPIY